MNTRLYFALWPDDAIRLQLDHQRQNLARESQGRAVFPATLHLTLAFLGDVDTTLMPLIEAVGDQVVGSSFTYNLNVAGCFPRA
ncbi:MAG: 2'-5' RNA ligase family protein, partial [Usitatibacteraceae bacterium]